MCFSASASFLAGSGLLVTGLVALRKTRDPSETMFASMPLLFGLQQLAEGVVWLTADTDSLYIWHKAASAVFLFFAFIIWPTWIPLALSKLEQNPFRKKVLHLLTAYGVFISLSLLITLLWHGTHATVEHHIIYKIVLEKIFSLPVLITLYAIATVLPFFVMSTKSLWAFGGLQLISAVITYYVFTRYFVSVWCFFAALISVTIVALLPIKNREKR